MDTESWRAREITRSGGRARIQHASFIQRTHFEQMGTHRRPRLNSSRFMPGPAHLRRAREEESHSRPRSSIFDVRRRTGVGNAPPARKLLFERRRRNPATLRHKRERPRQLSPPGPVISKPSSRWVRLGWLPKRNPSRTPGP